MVNVENLSEEQLKELLLSEEELQQLRIARTMPITFDDDCPETTPEMAMKFKRVNPPRKKNIFQGA